MKTRFAKPRPIPYSVIWLELVCIALILLFVYTAMSKLLTFTQYQVQMHIQPLPVIVSDLLIWTLPPVEIIAGVLLIFRRTRLLGLWICFFLMALFTGYVGMVLSAAFVQKPCPCGGAFPKIGWEWHFVLNIFFLLLSATGIYLINRERSVIGKE